MACGDGLLAMLHTHGAPGALGGGAWLVGSAAQDGSREGPLPAGVRQPQSLLLPAVLG